MSTGKSTTTLVVGATGATGKYVVSQLLERGQRVRVVVRSKRLFLDLLHKINPKSDYSADERLAITEAAVLDVSSDALVELVSGCDAVVSCLGHNMTLKGLYGKPRQLVTDAAKNLCSAIQRAPEIDGKEKTKFILMGSDGVSNPDGTDDKRSVKERCILSIIRALVPPHRDNESAAAYFFKDIGRNSERVEWTVVRPTDLEDGDATEYDLFTKPQGSLFGGGVATRANVAACMVSMILEKEVWEKWRFQMPVLHDCAVEAQK